MSLSPWDLSGNISFDFNLYRPRRPSYVFATQVGRRRSESYRHATKSDSNSGDAGFEGGFDFIDKVMRKKRKDSYKAATQHEEIELSQVDDPAVPNHVEAVNEALTLQVCKSWPPIPPDSQGPDDNTEAVFTAEESVYAAQSRWKYRKNLVVLTISFILVFTAFRSIQNLQSSLNTYGKLGVIAMGCVHCTMFLTCLFAPVLINKLTSKWTIILGLLFYLFWIVANFYPHFYTLIPTSIGVGFGQSLAWGAQVTYIQKLAVDYAQASKELTQNELYKFNGIFLACFQTSHIWGNLVSSLMLQEEMMIGPHSPTPDMSPDMDQLDSNMDMNMTGIPLGYPEDSGFLPGSAPSCGVYDYCGDTVPYVTLNISNTSVSTASSMVMKLMGAYLVFAGTGFVLILLFLEKIGAKTDPEKPCLQMVWNNVSQLVKHKTYRLLIPLLIFNGFEQGFIYADFNKSYIACTIGVQYVGYNMITLGMTNSLFSVLVGMVARHMPREAIIGTGCILHLGIMVFLLVWIPDQALFGVFFVISALWGLCDAIWQTQCNSLVNLSCPDDHDVAFQNFRMLQGLGASLAFMLGAFVCVSTKLYILISLLILSIMLYVVVEYQVRGSGENSESYGDVEQPPRAITR